MNFSIFSSIMSLLLISVFSFAAVAASYAANKIKAASQGSANSTAVKGSELTVTCFSPTATAKKAELHGCSSKGSLTRYEKHKSRTTAGSEKTITLESASGTCVISESLAKRKNIPYEMIEDLIADKRVVVFCTYAYPRDNSDPVAHDFSIRAYFE
jgi:hypothetical protein